MAKTNERAGFASDLVGSFVQFTDGVRDNFPDVAPGTVGTIRTVFLRREDGQTWPVYTIELPDGRLIDVQSTLFFRIVPAHDPVVGVRAPAGVGRMPGD